MPCYKRRANCSGGRSPALRQLLDTARVELCQRVTYAPTRNEPLRRDLRERHQDESAGEELRMWQRQIWSFQSHVLIGDEVDVDLARPPPPFLGTLAPERPLHRLSASQKRARGQARLNGDARVDEHRLIFDAPRQATIIRRAGHQAHLSTTA